MVCSQASFMLHKYQHFNPNKYELDVKIAVVKSGFHCKYNINYHFVWIPKYRKIVLEDQVKDELRIILTNECKALYLEMLALEIMPDHLHLFVGAKPTHNRMWCEATQGCVINPASWTVSRVSISWISRTMETVPASVGTRILLR